MFFFQKNFDILTLVNGLNRNGKDSLEFFLPLACTTCGLGKEKTCPETLEQKLNSEFLAHHSLLSLCVPWLRPLTLEVSNE